MWGNSEFRIRNSERFKYWRFFSDGFWAVLKKRDAAFGEFSTKRTFGERK